MSVVFALWILSAGQIASPAPPLPPAGAPKPVTKTRVDPQSASTAIPSKNAVPSMALIGFLGDYVDAGDGLDPMGLGEHPEVTLKNETVQHQP